MFRKGARQLCRLGHARELLGRVDCKLLGVDRSAVVHFLIDNLEQRQLELVAAFLAHTQVREDEERRILVVDVLQVVKRRHRCSSQETGPSVVDNMQF